MKCLFCEQTLQQNDKNVTQNPRLKGLKTIIGAAEKRRDICAQRILQQKEHILEGKIKVKFHITCRQTFISLQNIGYASQSSENENASSSSMRYHKHGFNIREMCLICNKSGKKGQQLLTSVQTGSGKSTYSKIIEAAQERQDIDMISKLAGYEDLFAYDAKYHKNCYCQYIGKRNIKACQNKSNIRTAQQLEHRSVLSEAESASSDSSASSNIKPNTNFITIGENEIIVLHRAAGILRKKIGEFNIPQSNFPIPDDMNQAEFEKQVPNELLQFVSWLIDDDCYESVSDTVKPQAAVPCNIIMSLHDKTFRRNNFQMGLGIYIYHLVRSQKILDILSNIGISCSYNDIRQLTTSLANKKISSDKVYVPPGLEMAEHSKGNYIHAAIDNFDLNEDTIGGKNTTHCMAMVVYQKHSDIRTFVDENIPKAGAYSLKLSEELDCSIQDLSKYQKPAKRPDNFTLKSVTLNRQNDERSKNVNLIWKLLRSFKDEKTFLNWTDFNNTLAENNIPVSDIYYLPFVNNPPTSYDTIYTSMLRLVELANAINQQHIIITADLAIYSKAREILWNNPDTLRGKVTLTLGGMHLNMALIASIGHIFTDGGLLTMLTETDVYAEATCKMMLQGKQYSRAIRGLTLAADALSRLFFKSLIKWQDYLDEDMFVITPDLKKDMQLLIQKLQNSSFDKDYFEKFINKIKPLQQSMSDFITAGSSNSNTFKYWYSFLEATDLLWRLIRSERNGDFESHLCAVNDCLPYLSAAGRNLYLKWVPVYLSDMQNLKDEIPAMYEYLANGNFVVKKTNDKIFNCVASDMALEQSVNKDCKSSAGVIGFSQKPSALLRWITTRHVLGEYSKKFSGNIINQNKTSGKEGGKMAIKNEEDILRITNSLENEWCNPFDVQNVPDRLINICTGKIADSETEKSLSNFLERAQEHVKTLLNSLQQSFWNPVKRNKTSTFSNDMGKKKVLSKKNFIGSECMFRRIICAARFQEMDLANILSYELTVVPISLFHEDGSMRKTTKSDLVKKIETFTNPLTTCPSVDSFIVDGMVSIQELQPSTFVTFNDLAAVFVTKILREGRKYGAKRITVVFDTYLANSLKNAERQRRGESNNEFKVAGSRKVPKFRDFIRSSANKRSLLTFIANYFLTEVPNLLNDYEIVLVAGGFENPQLCFEVSKNREPTEIKRLNSNQEEADTRLILHVIAELKADITILVKSVDTDVLILLLHFYCEISHMSQSNIYMELGHGQNSRFLFINNIVENLGTQVCKKLLAIHCLTGCDTTNAIYKIGKKTAFEALYKNIDNLKDLENLPFLSEEKSLEVSTKYTLYLYKNRNKNIASLNQLRWHLTTESNRPASELPPTDHAFRQHVKRCLYQLNIWYNSHNQNMPIEDPTLYGWTLEENTWKPNFSSQEPVPDDIRKSLSIRCSDKDCSSKRCTCILQGLKCCSDCKYVNCSNSLTHETLDENLSDCEDY